MTQRLGQHTGSGLLDPRDAEIARHAWDAPRWSKGDRVWIGHGDDARELLIDGTGFDDVRLTPFYVVIGAHGVQQYVDQEWLDEHGEELAPVAPVRLAVVCCRMCGRDEADGCGVIVESVCGDCRRAWA